MKLKHKIKKWLINKIAGDTLVILNAAIIYKYYPIFADVTENPIIEKVTLLKHNMDTPFNIYGKNIFDNINDELVLKEKYKEVYSNVIKEIQNKLDEEIKETNKQNLEDKLTYASIHEDEITKEPEESNEDDKKSND